jgi:hypothetical protein
MTLSYRSFPKKSTTFVLSNRDSTTNSRFEQHYSHTFKKIIMTTLNATLTTTAPGKGKVWAARIMGGITILFMLMDSIFKFIVNEEAIKGTVELGFAPHHLPILGTLGLISIILYAIPRTEILGAILLTGYWGGAIATHVRMDNPLFSHVLFPVYLGILAWGALWLKNERLRQCFSSK